MTPQMWQVRKAVRRGARVILAVVAATLMTSALALSAAIWVPSAPTEGAADGE